MVLLEIISFVALALNVLIFARVILSWLPQLQFSEFYRLIHRLTEPVLAPLRSIIPPIGGFDISPILAIGIVKLSENLLISTISKLY